MPSASITTRHRKDCASRANSRARCSCERRYVVRFRLGGRAYPIQHAGAFLTLREAQTRRDFVGGELAAGRNPAVALRALSEPVAVKVRTLTEWAPSYVTSRHDVQNVEAIKAHLKRVTEWGGDREPHSLTVPDCQEYLASLVADMKPDSVRRYFSTFRLLLDFAGVDPNPARDKRVKLPKVVSDEPCPPTAKQVLAILDHITDRPKVLPLVLMEQTAIEPGVVASLEWGDVDVAENRLRLKRRNVKGNSSARARSPQVPAWLMEVIEDTCPLDDRVADRRVFPGLSADALRNAMRRACTSAGIPDFSPYDLRHRRLSLWHGQGVPAAELKQRAGHSRASMTLDV